MRPVNHRYTLYLVVLLLGLASSACNSDSGPQLPRLTSAATLLAFGDSLTYGTGADRDESYPAVLAQLTGHTVINAGIPGEVSAQGRDRLPALLDRHRPALLLLTHGGNDMLHRVDPATTRNNLEDMIQAATQRGIAVILIGVPKPGLLFLETADMYDELAEKFNLVYEDSIFATVESDNTLKSDQIHPNAAGYHQIAESLFTLLSKHGALPGL